MHEIDKQQVIVMTRCSASRTRALTEARQVQVEMDRVAVEILAEP